MSTQNSPKNRKLFECQYCDYVCYKLSDLNKHNRTDKHKINKNQQKSTENSPKHFTCEKCNKSYKERTGLWKHKKQCIIIDEQSNYDDIDEITDKKLMMMLIKDNNDLKQLILDVVKNGTTNITHTNSHNKTFNLQVFLNETCKDAMNIMEFVDSIKLQLSDFERVGEVGFVNGISDIIIKNLKQLDITERPIHCTDKKREIMYVKDDNKWEKDDDTNKKVRKAIKYIANKNINLMEAYKALHPDCQKSHSIYSDSYNKFVIEALGGSGNEDCDNEDKIISRLSKVVTIEK